MIVSHISNPARMTATGQAMPIIPKPKGDRIVTFEGLRGILALIVCLGHLGLNTVAQQFGAHVYFELAVDVFFALSGFVLARSYYFGRRTFRSLWTGRVARLYPLHVASFILCLGLSQAPNSSWGTSLAWQNIFLAQNIGLPPHVWGFNFPSWSISVEMAVSIGFYFPLLLITSQARRLLLLGTGLGVIMLCARLGVPVVENLFVVVNSGLLLGAGWFAIGVAAYLFSVQFEVRLRNHMVATKLLLLAFAPFFLMSASMMSNACFAAIVFAALALAAHNDDSTFLSRRPFEFLGGISYSIYLLHMPVYWMLETLLGEGVVRGLAGKFFVVLTILIASTLTYHFYELPTRRILLRDGFIT